jgi:hypothetical protein
MPTLGPVARCLPGFILRDDAVPIAVETIKRPRVTLPLVT